MLNFKHEGELYHDIMASKSEQLTSKELLEQVLKCLNTLITFKENQLQKSEHYKQEIENTVNLIFEFLVKILTEEGLWNESEENVKATAQKILEFSLLTHLQFDSNWAKPSFHNEIHILAVICAFLEILPTLRHDDIFAIENTLNTWNHESEISESSTSPITSGEFALAMIMALATHDLGNILQEIQEQEGENPKAIFHEVYNAEGAEERSQAIASVLITKFNQAVDEAKIKQIIGLVQHLIEQTKFQPNPNLTEKGAWWLLVQIIDQIGGNVVLLSTNPNYYVSTVAGLIIEILTVRAANGINLTNFLNFIAPRLKILVPNKEKANEILALLSDKKFNLLTDPYLNQATEENFDYIVEILKKAFPDHQVITDETNQVFLTISQ
jgi:hypothetical protein